MEHPATLVLIAAALLGWIVLAASLVRTAERNVTGGPLPPPWRALTLAVLVAASALGLRPLPQAVSDALACTLLVLAAGADYRTGFLFDAITFPAALLVLALAVATDATASAAGGVALLVGSFGSVVVLSRGRALGCGDVKAMYALGAAFGPLESLVAIFAAAVSAIVAAAVAGRLERGAALSFGPHLAVGAVFALIAGGPVTRYFAGA